MAIVNPLDALALGQRQQQQFQMGGQDIQARQQKLQADQTAQQAAAARQAQLAGLQQQLGQGATPQQQLEQQFPAQAQATADAIKSRYGALEARDKQRFQSIAQGFQMVKGQPPQQQLTMLKARSAQLRADGVPSEDTDEVINLLEAGQVDDAQVLIDGAVNAGQALGLLEAPGGQNLQDTAKQREFDYLTAIVEADPKLETQRGKAAAADLGLIARAGSSAQERIAVSPELTEQVAASGATIEGAREEAKLRKELAFKPKIQAAVKLAEAEAAAKGETLTSLARSEAALPGLVQTVDILKELAPIATSTLGGRFFDAAVKESGFGATKGATARAKFIAIINNQVLPLLKETFGAAFTFQEGEALKATMGSPDASPAEKIAQLESFIEQKRRSISTSKRELGLTTVTAQDLSTMTDAQLQELLKEAQ